VEWNCAQDSATNPEDGESDLGSIAMESSQLDGGVATTFPLYRWSLFGFSLLSVSACFSFQPELHFGSWSMIHLYE
jgi:hypothetical protein